jgi:hypothetical protein
VNETEKDHHYSVKECPEHEQFEPGQRVSEKNHQYIKENIFTSLTYQAWYDEEFCQNYGS